MNVDFKPGAERATGVSAFVSARRMLCVFPWVLMAFCFAPAAIAQTNGSGETHTGALPRVVPTVFNGDVRQLPHVGGLVIPHHWNENEGPPLSPPPAATTSMRTADQAPNIALGTMPAALQNFAGLSYNDTITGGQAGAGNPPDTNGDVGLNNYIQAVNDAYAIYDKSGNQLAAFTENALWLAANSGTACDANNFGDPVAVYDALADRWILTNFAFANSTSGPFYQCFAVSKTNDPVAGGWYLYAVRMDAGGSGPPSGTLADYPKFGIWTDCLYMSSNEFKGNNFAGVAFASFERSSMYAGAALDTTNSSIGYINDTHKNPSPYTMLPSNLLGTSASSLPPVGTPNFYVSESLSGNAFEVRKFTPGQGSGHSCGVGGTMGAATLVSHATYTDTSGGNIVPQKNTTNQLDALYYEMMQKVQYRKIGAVESLWVVHSVRNTGANLGPQWAQLNVSGSSVSTAPLQQQLYLPDATLYRWMGSIAADGQGNAALGYSTSSASAFPSIAYSGRLAGDPLNNLSQTEVQLVAGADSETYNCGSTVCHRWGDYSAMSIDPADDCTFWYTTEYYAVLGNGSDHSKGWNTRIASFKFPNCSAATQTKYTITPSVSGGNGSISPPTAQLVLSGATRTFALTPSTGYHVASVGGTCGGALTGNSFTTAAATADCTVIASFAINTYTVTPSAGANGALTPNTPQTVNYNATTSFSVVPATGYHIASVSGCGGSLSGSLYTTAAITADCTVTASFAINTYTVTPSAGANGALTPNTPQTVNYNATTSFSVVPATGYHVASVSGCGGSLSGSLYTTAAITADCTVTASFAINTYAVTATAGANGGITPPTQGVDYGNSATFTITPATGYHVASVTGDTCTITQQGVTTTWVSGAIAADCAVSATFALNPATQLVFTTQPASLLVGTSTGAAVSIEDAQGNVETTDNTTAVSVSVNACGSTVLASAIAVNGVATFANLRFMTLASGLQLHATSLPLLSATDSGTFDVQANIDLVFADAFETCVP